MQIEDKFDSLEKLLETAESEGFAFRLGFESSDDDFDDDFNCSGNDSNDFNGSEFDLSNAEFSIETPEREIESIEKTIEGASVAEEKEELDVAPEMNSENSGKYEISDEIRNANVIYVDLFMKKSYKHTLIIEKFKDSESGKTIYEIVATCEATMC